MKRWLKIMLIVLAVLFVLAAALAVYGYYTYKNLQAQVTEVIALANDPSLRANFEALAKGDCSKLPAVESQITTLETKMKSLCSNIYVKYALMSGMIPDPNAAKGCAEINNPESQTGKALEQLRMICANQTAMQGGTA